MRPAFPAVCLGLLLAVFLWAPASAETFEMVSDTLVYDPETDMIRAEGNVKITGDNMNAAGQRGEATADGAVMRLSGGVDASWEKGRRKILCDELQSETEGESRRITALNVRRLEDTGMNVVLSADTVTGLMKKGVFIDLEARGKVVADTTAADGRPTKLTARAADYDRAKGVMVFSGDARAVQRGRTLEAERLIYRLETGRIEAEGNPRITVEMEQES
ncbi:MAG: LPS export ABC transporter periplasmic protein LptC [Thermovirgaceae bacterium]